MSAPASVLYLPGSITAFRCRCGCRVFGQVRGVPVCEACGCRYEGLAS